MSDWTTARVVRDRDGDMWGREREGWNLISAENTEAWYPSDDLLAEQFGPLVPVLDADGLPVVRTVGDLTARHIGKRVRLWPGTADGGSARHHHTGEALPLRDEHRRRHGAPAAQHPVRTAARGDSPMTTYYKAVRADGTDFRTSRVRWLPPVGESLPDGGLLVTHPTAKRWRADADASAYLSEGVVIVPIADGEATP